MRRLPLIPSLLTVTLAMPALAADDEPRHAIDIKMEKCTDADPSTAGMVACLSTAEEEWDRELNANYKKLQSELKGKPLELLKQSQRAWITHRDREHVLQSAIHEQLSGTMWGPVMLGHRLAIVKERAQTLRAYIEALADGRP